MAQYLRVVRRGKHNVRVELPDHTTQLVPVAELPLWELVVALANQTNNTEVINLDEEMNNLQSNQDTASNESPKEESTTDPSNDDRPKEEKPKKEAKSKKTSKADHKAGNFRKNTNGLGVDHPYETVNTDVETVEYEEGVEAPF